MGLGQSNNLKLESNKFYIFVQGLNLIISMFYSYPNNSSFCVSFHLKVLKKLLFSKAIDYIRSFI